jgi:YwiC-like protein
MRPQGAGYVLKEYGSWSVLLISFLTGLGVSRRFPWQALPVFLALALLINSKQAYTKWVRGSGAKRALPLFLAQIGGAAVILLAVYGGGVPQLLPLLVLPAAYLLMNRLGGEHLALTELLGFALLSLAAVLAKFLVVEGTDVRLYVAVALYFTAGVFKVKTILLRKTVYRILTVLYVLFAAYAYRRFHISWIILLPLVENIVMAATLYRVRLQTTGWIEVAKSLIFFGLMLWLF